MNRTGDVSPKTGKQRIRGIWIHLLVFLVLLTMTVYVVYMSVFAVLYYGYTHNIPKDIEFSNTTFLTEHDLQDVHEYIRNGNFPPKITVVSAYFRLGNIFKSTFNVYKPNMYMKWMSVFERMKSPIIFFTDDKNIFDFMTHLRRDFPKDHSQIFLINRNDLWAFSILDDVKKIFADPNYPKIHPDTVNAEYDCVMHSKAELVSRVIEQRMFRTKYIMWLDAGLFRHDVSENHIFTLSVPPGWDKNKIMYSQVFEFDKDLSETEVFHQCQIWVSGAVFLGRPEVMYVYTQEYMRAVKHFLKKGLMASDQQIVYAMYIPKGTFKPEVDVQPFPTHRFRDFYHLGYAMKDIYDTKFRSQYPLILFMLASL